MPSAATDQFPPPDPVGKAHFLIQPRAGQLGTKLSENSLLNALCGLALKNDLLLADDPGHTGSSLSSAGAGKGR